MSATPPPRRSLRRPIPPLIFLLVLALVALGVWWKVLQRDEERQAAAPDPCAPVSAAPVSVDPAAVQIRVYNASSVEGLAAQVSNELRGRGMQVTDVGNDPTERDVQGVGEVRFGQAGSNEALFVAANFPGLLPVPDTRADTVVDVALGPAYAGMVPPEQVPAAFTLAQSQAASSAAAC
ncbi:MAG: LytR C-terminal domain-containing protein [Geodermatophilaceae bacterium]